MHDLWDSSLFLFGGKQGGEEKMKMQTCNKENQAPAVEISAFIESNNRSITYPVLPALEPTATTTTTANVPKPSIPDRSLKRGHHPSAPSTNTTAPLPAPSTNTTTTIPNRPPNPSPNAQPREPLFLPRNHHSHSHSTDIEILQSAGRQACLKRGHLIPATATPCNVGRPRVKLGFLTGSPARKGWGEGVRRVFGGRREEDGFGNGSRDGSGSGTVRSLGGGRVEKGDEVEDDGFEDAVVVLDRAGGSDSKSSDAEEEGSGHGTAAMVGNKSKSAPASGRPSPGSVRLPLSRRNVAMLDTVPTNTSSLQPPHLSPGPAPKVRGTSRFAPRPANTKTSASTSASNSRSRYDTSAATGSFSPSRMFDAPPRRNPARLTKAKEKQASMLSKVHVPTTTTSVVSTFSKSLEEEEEEETDSSTPGWTDDEIFLRRFERSRGSKQAVAVGQDCVRKEVAKGARRSGTPGKGAMPAGEVTGVEARTATSTDGLTLEMGSVAIRSKRKQRGKKVRTGPKVVRIQGEE